MRRPLAEMRAYMVNPHSWLEWGGVGGDGEQVHQGSEDSVQADKTNAHKCVQIWGLCQDLGRPHLPPPATPVVFEKGAAVFSPSQEKPV